MTAPSTTLVLATANPNKVAELVELLADLPVDVVGRPDHVAEVEETGTTFAVNADLKAVAVARAVGCWALADDSGFETDALDGVPGVRSARFAADLIASGDLTDADLATSTTLDALPRTTPAGPDPEDEANRRALAVMLGRRPNDVDRARFRCALSLADPAGDVRLRSEGVVEGRVITAGRGTLGFGYDPMFVPDDGDGATFAEMSRSAKAAISHRGRALAALVEAMESTGWPGGSDTRE